MPHATKLDAYLWGIIAEWLGYIMLVVKAYTPLERRYTSPVGEIDLIFYQNNLLVFIEVKARPTTAQGLQSISPTQRIRIENAARNWIASHPKYARHDVRFDVIVVAPWRLMHHMQDAWRPNR